jgi:hypothetical protein
MKSLKMLMMAALTILSTSVFAQNETTKASKEEVMMDKSGKYSVCDMDLTKLKKEQMKMKVMKIYTCQKEYNVTSDMPGKYSTGGFALNLSPKEQMKRDALKSYTGPQYPDVAIYKTLINLSPKEQMKMKITRI